MDASSSISCRCRMSKCLKKYCECYAHGQDCTDRCACIDCFNTPLRKSTKRPRTYILPDGCNCSKSECLKKYCVCFKAGLYCGDSCRCTNCKNTGPPPTCNVNTYVTMDFDDMVTVPQTLPVGSAT